MIIVIILLLLDVDLFSPFFFRCIYFRTHRPAASISRKNVPTGEFFFRLPSAMSALIFLAKRDQLPFLSSTVLSIFSCT